MQVGDVYLNPETKPLNPRPHASRRRAGGGQPDQCLLHQSRAGPFVCVCVCVTVNVTVSVIVCVCVCVCIVCILYMNIYV